MGNSIKVPGWELKAAEFLAVNKSREFIWGKFDCCLFAADYLLTITGTDYAQNFRGRYTTETGAVRALKRYGAGDIQSTLNAILTPVKGRLNVQRGDVVLVNVDGIEAVAVFFDGVWCLSQAGVVRLEKSSILNAWRAE